MQRKNFRAEIFLVSLAVILLEISYTRVFSFKLFYYFTYLTIGIVLLGLGSGGVLVAVSKRGSGRPPEWWVAVCCLVASAAVPIGYAVTAGIQLNVSDLMTSPLEIVKLASICGLLFVPFLLVGVILSTIFGARPSEVDRLYFADLMGAALGCLVCVPLIVVLTPPGCIMLAGSVLALASVRLVPGLGRAATGAAWTLAAGLLGLALANPLLPDPVPDRVKTMSPQQRGERALLFSRWSPVFRVDVLSGDSPTRHLLNHDGMLGSSILGFDGGFESLERFEADPRAHPFRVLPPRPRVLIIGAAGGHEVLASLYFGADQITAVELNPVTVSLLREHFAEFTGRIADHERVELVNDEGRSFLSRDEGRYDLIWFVAPDSYAAMNAATSGAFVLSESYLYTEEMIAESLDHLTPEGMICVQFGEIDFGRKPNRTTRYLVTAREAMRKAGISDFGRHVAISTTPEFFTMATILLKRSPVTAEEAERFRIGAETIRPMDRPSRVWHAGGFDVGPTPDHPVRRVISLPDADLAAWHESYPYQVDSVRDDAPFFWHFASFEDALLRPWGESRDAILDPEDLTGERVLLVLLAFVVIFAALMLLLPLVAIRSVWREVPWKRWSGVYFACLGLGFMFLEIPLIQKLILLLGYPTYSLTVTLFSLLLFTGFGSLLSARYTGDRRRALVRLLGALGAIVVADVIALSPLIDALVGTPLALRAACAVLVLAPLGLVLGAFMPLGLATVSRLGRHGAEYVAWGWAVNGFFSVMASVLSTILAMSFGFDAVLLLALGIYAVGVLAFRQIPELA